MTDKQKKIRQKAVAICYDEEKQDAPKVVAKGAGLVAEKIIELAKENDIHIHEDPDLVTVLSKLDVDTHIPEDLYRAVAEVLAFVYQLNRKHVS